MASAAPCFGYQHLVTVTTLLTRAKLPAELDSSKALTAYEETQMTHIRAVSELVKSVKGAVSELYGARANFRQDMLKRKAETYREALKRQKMLNPDQREETTPKKPKQDTATLDATAVFD